MRRKGREERKERESTCRWGYVDGEGKERVGKGKRGKEREGKRRKGKRGRRKVRKQEE